jgi:methyl-accepting chemotaxis protein
VSESVPGATAPAGPRPFRQRRFLGRPADQFRTTLVPTLGAAVLLVFLLAAVHQVNTVRVRELAEANPGFADVLDSQQIAMESTLAMGAVFYLFGVLTVGLVHSGRLMGSLFAIHRRLRRVSEGDVSTPFKLRRGDYFQDVTEAFNAATAELRRQAGEDLADVDDLISILDRSPNAGPLRDGLRETLVEVRERKRRLLGLPHEDVGRARLRLVEPGRG